MQIGAYLILTLTTFIWGANAIMGKLAVGHISPLALTSLRWLLALALIVIPAIPHLKRDLPIIRQHIWFLAALGGAGFTLFNALLYMALYHTSTVNVVIEQAGMPLVIFLANYLILRIRVTWIQIAGFAFTFAGVAVTVSYGDLGRLLALELNRGDALMMLAVLLYGGYTVALRWKPPIHWMSLLFVLAATAFLTSLPLLAIEAAAGALVLPDARGWVLALATAIFPSLVAQACYIKGNELIGGNRASLFINLVPIFGTMLAVLVLGEAFHAFHALGLVLVLGGIAVAEIGKPRVA